jgi:outer membrane protein TolC
MLALAGALPAAGQAPAATPDTLRLAEVLAAVSAAPAVRAAQLDAAALDAEAGAAGAWPDPTVGVGVQPIPMQTAHGAQRSEWRLEQMVPWPGTRGLRREAAGHAADAADARADALLLDLSLEAQEAYHALARVQAEEALVRAFRQRLDAFAEAAAVRYEVGRGPQAAILRAQTEAWRMEERLVQLRQARALALATLARLMDRPALALDAAPGAVVVAEPGILTDVAGLTALARRLRPETAALEAERRRAEAEVALAEKAFYPEIGASVTYFDVAATAVPASDHAPATTTSGADALAVGVSVRVPLDRASRRAQREAARLRVREVAARREALDVAIEAGVAAHLHHLHHERETLWVYRNRLIPQAETTVEATLTAYTTGQADFLTLLDAERALFELRLMAAEASSRHGLAAARLARALGLPTLEALPTLLP